MALYTVRQLDVDIYRMVKFDDDFNAERIYALFKHGPLSRWECTCPQFYRKSDCKHIPLVRLFIRHERVNTGYFWDDEREVWKLPLNHPTRVLARKMQAKERNK